MSFFGDAVSHGQVNRPPQSSGSSLLESSHSTAIRAGSSFYRDTRMRGAPSSHSLRPTQHEHPAPQFQLRTIHAAAHHAVRAAKRPAGVTMGAVRQSDPSAPIVERDPYAGTSLAFHDNPVLSAPGVDSLVTDKPSLRSDYHVRSVPEVAILAPSRPGSGQSVTSSAPSVIDTSRWGNFFHERARDAAIETYIDKASSMAMQTKDFRTYSSLKSARQGKAGWQRRIRAQSAGVRRPSTAGRRSRPRTATLARSEGSTRKLRSRARPTSAATTGGRQPRRRPKSGVPLSRRRSAGATTTARRERASGRDEDASGMTAEVEVAPPAIPDALLQAWSHGSVDAAPPRMDLSLRPESDSGGGSHQGKPPRVRQRLRELDQFMAISRLPEAHDIIDKQKRLQANARPASSTGVPSRQKRPRRDPASGASRQRGVLTRSASAGARQLAANSAGGSSGVPRPLSRTNSLRGSSSHRGTGPKLVRSQSQRVTQSGRKSGSLAVDVAAPTRSPTSSPMPARLAIPSPAASGSFSPREPPVHPPLVPTPITNPSRAETPHSAGMSASPKKVAFSQPSASVGNSRPVSAPSAGTVGTLKSHPSIRSKAEGRLGAVESFYNVYRNVVRSNAVLEVGDTPKDGVPLSILHRIPGGIAPPSSAVHRKRKSPPPALRRQPSLLEKAEASAASIMQKKASARDLARSESKASIAEETGPSENETDSDDWKSVPLTDEEGDSGSRDDDDPDVANDPDHGAEGLDSDSKSADNPTPSLTTDKPTAPASGSSTSGSPSKGTDTGLDGAELSRGSVAEGGDSDAGSSVQGGEQAITVDLSNLDNLGELGGIAKPTDDHDLDEEELNIPVRATTPRTAGLMKATDMGLTPMITGLHKISQGIVNISGAGIGNERAQVLAAGIQAAPNLKQLRLRQNRLTHVGLTRILHSVRGEHLITLDVGHNTVGHQGAQLLAALIVRDFHSLTTLGLESCGLQERDVCMIADALQASVTIRTLVLRGNAMTHKAISAVGQLLAWQTDAKGPGKAHNLPKFMVGQTWEDYSDHAMLGKIEKYKQVKGSVNAGDERTKFIIAMMEKSEGQGKQWGVQHLDLAWTNIDSVGGQAFFDAIGGNQRLETLDLGSNRLGSGSASEAMAKALGNFLKMNSSLTHLNLSHNHLQERHAAVLAPLMEFNRSLLGLHLSGNEIVVNSRGFIVPHSKVDPRSVVLPPVEHYVNTVKRVNEHVPLAEMLTRRASVIEEERQRSVEREMLALGVGGERRKALGGLVPGASGAAAAKHLRKQGDQPFNPLDPSQLHARGLKLTNVVPAVSTSLQRNAAVKAFLAGAHMPGEHVGLAEGSNGLERDEDWKGALGDESKFEVVTAILVEDAARDKVDMAEAYNEFAADATNGHTQHRIVSAGLAEQDSYRPRTKAFGKSSCWICGAWRSVVFRWIPAVSGPAARNVELMVDFDGWKAEPMQPGANGSFCIARMVPSCRFYFMFRVDGKLRVSQSELFVHRDRVGLSGEATRSSQMWSDALRALVVPTRGEDGFMLAGGVYVNYLCDSKEDAMLRVMASAKAKREAVRRRTAASSLRRMGYSSRSVLLTPGAKTKGGHGDSGRKQRRHRRSPSPPSAAPSFALPASTTPALDGDDPASPRDRSTSPPKAHAAPGGFKFALPQTASATSALFKQFAGVAADTHRSNGDSGSEAGGAGAAGGTTTAASKAGGGPPMRGDSGSTANRRRRGSIDAGSIASRRNSTASVQSTSRRGASPSPPMSPRARREAAIVARQQSRRASITGGRRRSTSGRRSSTSGISLSSLVSRRASLASRRSSLASRRSSVASSASRRGSAVSLGAIASAAANAKRRGRRASLSSAAAYTDASVAMGVAGGKKDAGDFLDARLATTHMDDSLAKQQLNPDIIHEFAHRVAAKLNRQPQLDSDSDSNSDDDSTTSSSDSGDDTDSSASVSGGEEQATPASMRGRSARRGGFISPNNFVLPKEVLSVGFKKRSLFRTAIAVRKSSTSSSKSPKDTTWSASATLAQRKAMLVGAGGSMKSLTRQGAKPMTLNVLATLARLPGAMKRRSTPTHAKARKHVAPPAVPQLNKLRGLKLLKAAAHRVGLLSLLLKRAKPPTILPRTRNPLHGTAQLQRWTLKHSVFDKYRQETPALLDAAFESDWNKCQITRIVKARDQLPTLKRVLRKHYAVLKDIFKYYAARGHTDAHLFSIDWGAFTELAYKAKLKCKRVPLHVLDSIFINTNAANMGQPMNPERALTRYEFLEAIVRTAKEYFGVSLTEGPRVGKMSVGEAVDVIINDNLSLAHRRDSHRWRYARLYFEEVHMVLSSRMSVLKSVYEVYSNRYAIAGETRWMSVQEWLDLLDDAELMLRPADYKIAVLAFVYAQQLEVEETERRAHMRLSFVEFLEAMGRLADSLFDPDEEVEPETPPPLCQRLPRFIDAFASTLSQPH